MSENEFNDDFVLSDILSQFSGSKTADEIEKENERYREEILSKGFLPINDELHETMSSSMEDVEKNPRQFIIEECIPACEELWKKNIYTFMVSDHVNEGQCWIEVKFDNLSDENKEIFSQLEGEDVIKFSYHKGCVNFGVKSVGLEGQLRLLELAKQFKMQDVPYKEAYITLPEYLLQCGCYDEVDNPNYEPMDDPMLLDLPIEQLFDYMNKYDEWISSDRSKKTFKVFNPSKVVEPIEHYFDKSECVYDGDRVYLNNYHYQKHINYVNSLSNEQTANYKK